MMRFSIDRNRVSPVAALIIWVLPSFSTAQEAVDNCILCEEGAALIERVSLREAPTPVREREGWSPPEHIVVLGSKTFGEFVKTLAPDARVDFAVSLAEAENLIADADVYIGICSAELLRRGINLRWIQILRAGTESCTAHPDLAERAILVTNLQRIFGPQIAEHAIAMMFSLARGLNHFGRLQAEGDWSFSVADISQRLQQPGWEVGGKTLLVVGLGGIGTEIAALGSGLGMRVIATRNSRREGPDFVEYVGLAHEVHELAGQADVVVSAVPLTTETAGMFDSSFFGAMRPTAVFINIGRGQTVVTDELVEALRAGELSGAGLDVTDPEPLPPGHPLWSMPNVILTPHTAAVSDRVQSRVRALLAENVRRYIAGDRMLSVVDARRGY